MVLFFCVTLLISIIGLVSLLYIKHWEMATGNMLLARVRPKAGNMSHLVLLWVEKVLPSLVADYVRRTFTRGRAWAHQTAAHGLLSAEQTLEHLLLILRGVTEHQKSNTEASAFLREVAEHKRKLQEGKIEEHTQ